jgi:hypothetical protein
LIGRIGEYGIESVAERVPQVSKGVSETWKLLLLSAQRHQTSKYNLSK